MLSLLSLYFGYNPYNLMILLYGFIFFSIYYSYLMRPKIHTIIVVKNDVPYKYKKIDEYFKPIKN